MIKDILMDTEERMQGAIRALEENLNTIRTGRAHPSLVEKLPVEYYGTPTPLQQLATISAPEPQLITIRPFDPGSVSVIERAIQASNLGLTPSNDGKIIRLALPPLTEERRRDLTKYLSKQLEEAKVAIRNVRRDNQDMLRDLEKEKEIGEDDFHAALRDLQMVTDTYSTKVDELGKRKEQEIMEV